MCDNDHMTTTITTATAKHNSYDRRFAPGSTVVALTDIPGARPIVAGEVLTTVGRPTNAGFRGIEICVADYAGNRRYGVSAGLFRLVAE